MSDAALPPTSSSTHSQLTSKTNFDSLVDLLRFRAEQQPDDLAYVYLDDGHIEADRLTYADLDLRVRSIAAHLQAKSERGDRALLLYPTGPEFLASFFGCLYAGLIAIPAPPPQGARRLHAMPRLTAIVEDAGAKLILGDTATHAPLAEDASSQFGQGGCVGIDTTSIAIESADDWREESPQSDKLAYLQYTSGSTRSPMGVMISHDNVLRHCRMLQAASGYDSESKNVAWMPHYHDYGLVEGLLQPLFNGTPCYVMSPTAFIKRPFYWLQSISMYRATHSQGPNFAYDHCVRRIHAEQLEKLDLRSWRAAGNGAEPINPEVLWEFYRTFKTCGFRWQAFCPAYGLAEATLVVTCNTPEKEPTIGTFQVDALEGGRAVEVTNDKQPSRDVVGCGKPIGMTDVAIVDPDTKQRCVECIIGEIWVHNRCVADGYWKRPVETEDVFRGLTAGTNEGPYLRTGDLGFLKDGELFITGRIKDLIIIRGTNHNPQDLEWTVQRCHPALRWGNAAAFSVVVRHEEKLVIVQEVERRDMAGLDSVQVMKEIRESIGVEHQLDVYAVSLCQRGTIPKTASGKIQRSACRARFSNGTLDLIATWSAEAPLVPQSNGAPTVQQNVSVAAEFQIARNANGS